MSILCNRHPRYEVGMETCLGVGGLWRGRGEVRGGGGGESPVYEPICHRRRENRLGAWCGHACRPAPGGRRPSPNSPPSYFHPLLLPPLDLFQPPPTQPRPWRSVSARVWMCVGRGRGNPPSACRAEKIGLINNGSPCISRPFLGGLQTKVSGFPGLS